MSASARKKILFTCKALISIGLLSWLLSSQDWSVIKENLFKLSPLHIAATLTCYFVSQLIASYRWYITGHSLQLPGTRWFYVQLYFIGMFFNLFLPTGMGGDVVKSYKLGNRHKKHGAAACSILIERGIGLVAMLMLGAMSTFFIPPVLPVLFIGIIRLVALGALGGMCLAPAVVGVMARVIPKLNGFQVLIGSFYENKIRVLKVFALSLVIQFLSACLIVVAVRALEIPVSLMFCITAYAVAALSIMLPAINGLGVREAGLTYLFSLVGVPAESAISVGLIIFCSQALVSLLGIYPLFNNELHVPRFGQLEQAD
jgi:uncharacterized membrane protein YbhN (UPF0104 family)